MKDLLINAISSGFQGEWTHIDPMKALAGLSASTAKKKSNSIPHSCWELLHHIVIWQDIIIRQIKGEKLNWNEIEQENNWPTREVMDDDSNWWNLVTKFKQGKEEAATLLMDGDFAKISSGFPELTTIKLYLVLLQHTSYHIGQLITIRQILGDWPPKTSDN
ncbi:MAG: DinB family protein [Candidatus Heimdallarchaeota archaeon]|nr:MAG: DinB family protein [Candidatus Heimdallarchaeota archaeon]